MSSPPGELRVQQGRAWCESRPLTGGLHQWKRVVGSRSGGSGRLSHVSAEWDPADMENMGWLAIACEVVLDAVTSVYRLMHFVVEKEGASEFEVASLTWFCGTLGTLFVLVTIAFLWDALFSALRWRSKSVLRSAMRGANLSAAQTMARRYVRFDHSIGVIQRMSGIQRGFRKSPAPKSFSTADLTAWVARLGIMLPSTIASLVKFILQPSVIVLLGVSVGATWWVIDRPNLKSTMSMVTEYSKGIGIQVNPVVLSAAGVGIAALTFVLSRIRSVNARGHQEWLKNESTKASNGLAVREIALSTANDRLRESLPAIHSRWGWSLLDFDDQAKAARLAHEWELRTRLRLSVPPEVEREHSRARFRFCLMTNHGPTVRDHEIVDYGQAIDRLHNHLKQSSHRSDVRLVRSVPWRIVRRARTWVLKMHASRIARQSTASSFAEPELTAVDRYLRHLVYDRDDVYPIGEVGEDYDFEDFGKAEREIVVKRAIAEWRAEVDRQRQRLARDIHRRFVEVLVSMAELELAEERVRSFVHPTRLGSKLFEWLKGS